jgi:ribosomal protein S12 methylthiotransferase accessory factor YcaO
MVSLAALRYRNVLERDGGPIAELETGPFPVRGRQMVLVNARLRSSVCPRHRGLTLFSAAHGTGLDPVPSLARHKAISEALERWAFQTTVRADNRADYGFDSDPSSTGMAAFPGLLRRQARRSAVLEAVERFSLIGWWDGLLPGRVFETDWPGVSAVAIDGPFGGMTVVTYARTSWGGWVYGHAAEESFGAACERAVMELARHEWILRARWLMLAAGEPVAPTNIFERRCLFFASDEGHELFQERIATPPSGRMHRPEIICDRDIPGPWADYATVWRFALRPLSDGYLHGGESYFFL